MHVGLFRFENGARIFLEPLPEEQVEVQGNHIRLRLGYDLQGSGLSKDKIIDL